MTKKEIKETKVKEVEETEVEELEETGEVEETVKELTMEERIVVVEKKVTAALIIIIVTAILSVATLCITISNNKDTKKTEAEPVEIEPTEEELGEYDVSKFEEITAKDIKSKSKGKTIVVYIGRETCGYCVKYVPVLKEVQKANGFKAKYIDIAKIIDFTAGSISDNDSYETLINLKTSKEQKGVMDNFGATPMTLVIKDNKIVDSIIGYVENETLQEVIKNNGLAK